MARVQKMGEEGGYGDDIKRRGSEIVEHAMSGARHWIIFLMIQYVNYTIHLI
jgi:hypothetical protein